MTYPAGMHGLPAGDLRGGHKSLLRNSNPAGWSLHGLTSGVLKQRRSVAFRCLVTQQVKHRCGDVRKARLPDGLLNVERLARCENVKGNGIERVTRFGTDPTIRAFRGFAGLRVDVEHPICVAMVGRHDERSSSPFNRPQNSSNLEVNGFHSLD